MSISEFLSHEEVCELTGAKTKANQIAVLCKTASGTPSSVAAGPVSLLQR
ncbi:DUF4224 domain-containing protein [Pseudomonas sp. SMN5]